MKTDCTWGRGAGSEQPGLLLESFLEEARWGGGAGGAEGGL